MNKKPTALKRLEGNPGKRPLGEDEPKPEIRYEGPPAYLDEESRKFWIKYAAELRSIGLLTIADHAVFENLCRIWSRLQKVREQIDDDFEGSTIVKIEHVGQDGEVWYEVKQNPLSVIEKQYLLQFRHHASEFGLTPRGRTGLSYKPKKEDDDDGIL